jgi:hypothetical protein
MSQTVKADRVLQHGVLAWRRLRSAMGRAVWGDEHTQRVFSRIYERNAWSNPESRSGQCATVEASNVVRRELPPLLRRLGAHTMLDAPCGDFNWMRHVELPLERYIGADIVPGLIERNRAAFGSGIREFQVLDITRDAIPRVDVVFCRDCLVHLSLGLIEAAIANFKRSGSTFLLTTSYTASEGNRDIATGDVFLLNLEKPPFAFPRPLDVIQESPTHGRILGLWRIEDL